jgi:hypothetical protein
LSVPRSYREFMVPAPEQVDRDHLYAFSCALNLQLYASDPSPETVVVGGPGEQRPITRRESLVDIYARMVLLKLGGDIDRLSAVAAEARRCLEEKPCGEFDTDYLEDETVVSELAETAIQWVREAGADVDATARERMLTTMDYQTSRDVFGVFLGNADLAGPPDDMLTELEKIDQDSQGG